MGACRRLRVRAFERARPAWCMVPNQSRVDRVSLPRAGCRSRHPADKSEGVYSMTEEANRRLRAVEPPAAPQTGPQTATKSRRAWLVGVLVLFSVYVATAFVPLGEYTLATEMAEWPTSVTAEN